MTPATAFALATCAHLGFQLSVTALVYPALARVGPEGWPIAHVRHSRSITPLVVATYAALVVTGGAVLLDRPSPASALGLVAAAATIAVTALWAAPTHGRLTRAEPDLLRRLLLADRVRAALAVVAAVAAVGGVPAG
ncbi:MAG: hypothetical protein F2667_01580 [Actinobacteria bacterium]|uniref:Unannotated protein n=1 Tax=freshwater metagenome TaxID=449393 RepID=A0A6J6NSH9_9ZZZZ|nr:hypothetical protein [Actinomycetota bacterium]